MRHRPARAPAPASIRTGESDVRLVFVTPEKVGPGLWAHAALYRALLHSRERPRRSRAQRCSQQKRRWEALSGARRPLAFRPQVARSDALMRALDGLAAEGRLARVVVDEAHCVSVRALAL